MPHLDCLVQTSDLDRAPTENDRKKENTPEYTTGMEKQNLILSFISSRNLV